ncbi:uncharacterized protein LOC123680833 [Harmonia axyridis]|uniref:uncharacterized protein LOC123680833 n=1 Tax=Harmonia axyridis TaxID=115357 RepID=UPI001E276284|nr:uncharacterized protein LOC123680833 [Harmonia axyridis]
MSIFQDFSRNFWLIRTFLFVCSHHPTNSKKLLKDHGAHPDKHENEARGSSGQSEPAPHLLSERAPSMDDSVYIGNNEEEVHPMKIYEVLANFQKYRNKYKDPLILLLYVTLEPMKFKIILLVLHYVTFQFSFALCLTIYRMLSTFDKEILLKHGSFGGIEIFVLINLWTVLLKYKDIMWFSDTFQSIGIPLNAEVIGEKKYNKLCSKIFVLRLIVLINYGLALLAALGFTLSPEYFNKRTYLAVWIRENFPNYSEYILTLIHMSNFPVALVLSALAIAMSYFGYSAVFQLIFINEAVKGICYSTIPLHQRYSSQLYQTSVRTRLKISIMLHTLGIQTSLTAMKIIYFPLIAFSLGAVVLGGSLLLEFFTNDSTQMTNQYYGIICFALAGTISSALYVSSGQNVKNESERTLYLLNQLPWYYMNKENIKIYSIFTKRAERPISMSNSLLEINFLLLVRITEILWVLLDSWAVREKCKSNMNMENLMSI